jgi:hypothetical protein
MRVQSGGLILYEEGAGVHREITGVNVLENLGRPAGKGPLFRQALPAHEPAPFPECIETR